MERADSKIDNDNSYLSEHAQSLASLSAALDWLPLAMMVIDARGLIASANAQAERLLGHARGTLRGKPVDALVPQPQRGQHASRRLSFLDHPTTRPMGAGRELFALHADGRLIPVEIGLNPVELESGTHVVAAIVDMTERRERERVLSEALAEKGLLLSEVHHRVKNNLQIIHSLLDLQAMRTDDPRARSMLHDSQNRVRSMSLVHQTLYQSNDFAQVDFPRFLRELVDELGSSFAGTSRRVALVIDDTPVSLPIVSAVPCALIVNELVTNALKHAFPGGRKGEIRIGIRRQDNDDLELTVENDGVPLPADFDTTKTLGMKLVALLARQLKGQLNITPDPCSFAVRFPQDHGP